MKKIFIASLLLLMTPAADAVDHLLPISPGDGLVGGEVDKAWLKVFKEDDVAFVRFDIRPAFNAPSHLAVFGPAEIGKKGPFRLCYVKGSYREETPACVPIGDDFETALAAKVENIIRRDAHYGAADDDLAPLDSTLYFFAANFTFAKVEYAAEGSVPRRLIEVFTKCEKLTEMKPDDAKRQALMDEVLNDLDAIKLP